MNFKVAFCFFLIAGQLFSQDFVNGSFTNRTTGWGCTPEILPETTYGGVDPNNIVAEIDQQAHLCQTLSGFKVGTIYSLSFLYSPRTTCGPAVQEMEFSIDKGVLPPTRLTRIQAAGFNWVNIDFCFTAVSTTHTFSFRGLSPTTCGIIIDDFKINHLNIDLGKDFDLCTNTKLLNATHPNAVSYLWQDKSTNPTFTITKSGVYWAKITDRCFASVIDTITVGQKKIPTIDLGKDITFCKNKLLNLTLNATTPEATSYLWQDNSSSPNLAINKEGTYWVEASNICGSARDTVNVTAKSCTTVLVMPNVFTPNKDGVNDFFIPIKNKDILSMNTKIYDRWGKLTFESNSTSIYWDGVTPEGKRALDGVYFWIINYFDTNGIKNQLRGSVTVKN